MGSGPRGRTARLGMGHTIPSSLVHLVRLFRKIPAARPQTIGFLEEGESLQNSGSRCDGCYAEEAQGMGRLLGLAGKGGDWRVPPLMSLASFISPIPEECNEVGRWSSGSIAHGHLGC